MKNKIENIKNILIIKGIYGVKYCGLENIDASKPFILAGNHINELDLIALKNSIKRDIVLYNDDLNMQDIIKNNKIIIIFPEGKVNDTEYIIQPFKMETVRLACTNDIMIIPFGVKGEYQKFKKSVNINFGKPFQVEKLDLKKSNAALMNMVVELIK